MFLIFLQQKVLPMLVVLFVPLFIWSIVRWTGRQDAKELKKEADFLAGLKCTAIHVFQDDGVTFRSNYDLKATLFVWSDKNDQQFVSDYASYCPQTTASKVDPKEAVRRFLGFEHMTALTPVVPMAEWRNLLPTIEYDE
jgi:hypothetical protein